MILETSQEYGQRRANETNRVYFTALWDDKTQGPTMVQSALNLSFWPLGTVFVFYHPRKGGAE